MELKKLLGHVFFYVNKNLTLPTGNDKVKMRSIFFLLDKFRRDSNKGKYMVKTAYTVKIWKLPLDRKIDVRQHHHE